MVGILVFWLVVFYLVDNGGIIVGYRIWGGEGEVLLVFWFVFVFVFCELFW